MSSLDEAKNLIDTLVEIQKSYTRNIPKSIKSNTDTTIALVKAVRTDPGVAGNEDYYSESREVQVQIFYADNIEYDPEILESKILKLYTSDNWTLVENSGIQTDPDTFQLYESFYVRLTKYLN
ncbi:DUF806 family protein [Liquorilactobacillus uvarum]|uniref:DUF806 family protein n=1 Tax=Liquorilactobacillus uvarum TaxID=303240 RepID=UPI00070F7D04|nr:DUF806 family protein [Liquorilactobacillus uvarum]